MKDRCASERKIGMNKIEGLTSAILLEADGFLSHSCPVMASLIRQYAPCTLINGAFSRLKP